MLVPGKDAKITCKCDNDESKFLRKSRGISREIIDGSNLPKEWNMCFKNDMIMCLKFRIETIKNSIISLPKIDLSSML